MNNQILFSVSLLIGLGAATPAFSQEAVDYSTPYINPQRDCLTEGMINPEGKDYRYLFSRDCRVVHVLPPPVMEQNIKGQGVNLQACDGLANARRSLTTQEEKLSEAEIRLLNYERAVEKAGSKAEEERLNLRIRDLNARLPEYRKVLKESQSAFNKHYGATPGAIFSIVMNGNISQSELNQLRGLNLANLSRKKTIVEKVVKPDGSETIKTTDTREESALRAAQIGSSIFSFVYNVPKDAVNNGGVISTDIPNLEYLQSKEAIYKGVIHVKSNGGVSGKVVTALTLACDHVKPSANGTPTLDVETDPFFTVSRTFEVQQMFAQGYVATLNVDKVVNQITKFTMNHTQEGFKKSAVFTPILNADVSELMDFKWTTEFETTKNLNLDQVAAIKANVAAKLVDDYISSLEKEGVLIKKVDPVVEPVMGANVDEARKGHRCWTESDGGISGVLGGRHTVCGDFTYVVKVWHDGVTEDTVNRSLTLHGETKDVMSINTVTPFYFTTAFVKNSSER